MIAFAALLALVLAACTGATKGSDAVDAAGGSADAGTAQSDGDDGSVVAADPPVAYPLDRLREERVVHDTVEDRGIVVLWTPGTASALDSQDISEGRDVGAVGVFETTVDGTTVSLRPGGDDRFVDDDTGSVFNVLGQAVEGPLEGTQLSRVPHDDTFWFVQFALAPETDVRAG